MSALLDQLKSGILQKKHIEYFDKNIGKVLRDDDKNNVSHFWYQVKSNGVTEKRALPEFAVYESYQDNARGIFARGGCSFSMKFSGSESASTPQKSNSTNSAK